MPVEMMLAAVWKASLEDVKDSAVKNCLIVLHDWLMMISEELTKEEPE
jgi:hypothetical protein